MHFCNTTLTSRYARKSARTVTDRWSRLKPKLRTDGRVQNFPDLCGPIHFPQWMPSAALPRTAITVSDDTISRVLARSLTSRRNSQAAERDQDADHLKNVSPRSLCSRYMSPDLYLAEHATSLRSHKAGDSVPFDQSHRIRPANIFIDFGIERGHEGNSAPFADVLGWNGLLIGRNARNYRHLKRNCARISRANSVLTEFRAPQRQRSLTGGRRSSRRSLD